MESLESFFDWEAFFEPRLHAISLFFSNISRCNRFNKICIKDNRKITVSCFNQNEDFLSNFDIFPECGQWKVELRKVNCQVVPKIWTIYSVIWVLKLCWGWRTSQQLHCHVSDYMPGALQSAVAVCVSCQPATHRDWVDLCLCMLGCML